MKRTIFSLEPVKSRPRQRVFRDGGEGLLARLSLYHADDLLFGSPARSLYGAGALGRVLKGPLRIFAAAGGFVLLGAVPWMLAGSWLGRGSSFYEMGVLAAFMCASVVVGWRALKAIFFKKQTRLDPQRCAQSVALFQALSRILPYARRRAPATLVRDGERLSMELPMLTGEVFRLEVGCGAYEMSGFVSHNGAVRWSRAFRASDGLTSSERALSLAEDVASVVASHRMPARSVDQVLAQERRDPVDLERLMSGASLLRFDEPERAMALTVRHRPVLVSHPRSSILARMGWLKVCGFWGLGAVLALGYALWFAPMVLRQTSGIFGALFLGLVGAAMGIFWVAEQPFWPRIKPSRVERKPAHLGGRLTLTRGVIQMEGGGRLLLDDAFRVVLTRSIDGTQGPLMNVQVFQKGMDVLSFGVPVLYSSEWERLEELDLDAPLVDSRAFERWLWPVLWRHARMHGQTLLRSSAVEILVQPEPQWAYGM